MGLYEVHGMPSDHSQTFFYFMTYLAIFIILKQIDLFIYFFFVIKSLLINIRSQMPGTPRIRSLRNRFLVFSQLIVAALVAYSR